MGEGEKRMKKITQITAREILNSRGNPTIECHLFLSDGFVTQASVPSGASVGSQEACELRDGDLKRFNGMGVLKAIGNIKNSIAPALINKTPDFQAADQLMIALDGTPNKSNLGANAILAVSMAITQAQAYINNQELYAFLGDFFGIKPTIPRCMFNILNGGAHADNGVTFQEFMIMPMVDSVIESVRMASEIYHALKKVLKNKGYTTTVGDEGGFAPCILGNGFSKEIDALHLLVQAIEQAGYQPGNDVMLCLDVAATQFYNRQNKNYYVAADRFDAKAMISIYQELSEKFPIFMIEDGLSEYDHDGWQLLTKEMGAVTCLVGDDIFVTNYQKIEAGVRDNIGNGVLIKPNQIGTVSEAAQALLLAKQHRYTTVVSHRSGETNSSFIADFAVGMGAGYLKAGAPARGERVAKYNRLRVIETYF